MAFVRILIGYLLSVVIATAVASLFQTQMVISKLGAAGLAVSSQTRLNMSLEDIVGLAPQFGGVVAIGFAVAFLIAAALKRVAKQPAPIAYPLAGAAAIALALILMPFLLKLNGLTPLAGTRGAMAFALQCVAGAIGGLVFAGFASDRRA